MTADVIQLADHRPLPEAEAAALAWSLPCPHRTAAPEPDTVARSICCADLRRLLRTRPVAAFHDAYAEVLNRAP